jgi:hypothetical protein
MQRKRPAAPYHLSVPYPGLVLRTSTKREWKAATLNRASTLLTQELIYTREELRRLLKTRDATINTGVFRPAGFSSVLIFITKNKPSDRTQYKDRLDGDTLYWQGQTTGRTDTMIVEHEQRDLEVLVFYRDHKSEYPGAGFRYEGAFKYVSHKPGHPSDFVLTRTPMS